MERLPILYIPTDTDEQINLRFSVNECVKDDNFDTLIEILRYLKEIGWESVDWIHLA
jgi:hypothetical protein